MTNTAILAFIALLALPALAMTPAQAEPERVTVQHILIAFKGSLPGDQKVTRSMADAETLAMKIFERRCSALLRMTSLTASRTAAECRIRGMPGSMR